MQGTGPYSVFVDANVWFSRTLRDWLGMLYTLADSPPFVVHWSEDVLAEVVYHLRRAHPEWAGGHITRIRDRLAETFEAGRVEDFAVDGSYGGTDPGDTHVHSAAVACHADVLLTCDVTDFRWDENASTYEVMHPDDFFVLVDLSAPDLVAQATEAMCDHWVSRTGEADLPARLVAAGCPEFAKRVLRHLHRAL